MGHADYSNTSAIVNRMLISHPLGVSMLECADEAERAGLILKASGRIDRSELENEVLIVFLNLAEKYVIPRPISEAEHSAVQLWRDGTLSADGWEGPYGNAFFAMKWIAISKALPIIGYLDL